jgi:WD40 repeat protein
LKYLFHTGKAKRLLLTRFPLIFVAALSVSFSAEAGLLNIFSKGSLTDGSRFAFIPSLEAPGVVAIDTYKKESAGLIKLPEVPDRIIVSDKLDLLFVTHRDSPLVTLVDLASKEVVKRLDIGMKPHAMLLNPFDRYVAFGSRDGSVSVWDMRNFEQMLRVDGLESAENITFGVDGRNLYVIEEQQKKISVVEMHARKKVAEIPLGGKSKAPVEISGLSRSADGYTGFVSITSEDRIVVIDLINWEVKKSIAVGKAPVRPYSTADNRYILVPHRQGKTLTVLSALSQQIIATISTGIQAREINTGWLDTVAFIMPEEGNKIAVIDLRKLSKVGVIELPGPTDDGLVTSDTKMLFAGIPSTGDVIAIDARSRSLVGVIKTQLKQIAGIEIAISNNLCH